MTLLGSKGSPFFFQELPVHQPDYIVFSRHEQFLDINNYKPPPFIGYVHYTSVNGDRRKQFEPCPGPRRTSNSVGMNICLKKRLAQTTPKKWTEDPYFMCHLLALAQLQEHDSRFPRLFSYTVSL